jgi:chromosome partitioning protein
MKIIVAAATKGGTGKTSLTYNLAIKAAEKHQVLIADLDPQKSLKRVWEKRGELINPRLVSNIQSLPQSIKLLTEAGYDREFMFVDTPGSLIQVIRDALSAADCIVLPIQPSPMDWVAQEAVADLVQEMGLADRAIFVVNKVTETKSGLVDQAKEFFAMRTRYPIHVLKHRAEYARAVDKGKAGCELNKDAGAEISKLWKLIQTVIADQSKAKETKTHDEHRRVH